jgi:hypothetical protein
MNMTKNVKPNGAVRLQNQIILFGRDGEHNNPCTVRWASNGEQTNKPPEPNENDEKTTIDNDDEASDDERGS